MAEIFVSKVRPIGSSLGVIIPKEIIDEEKLEAGEKVQVSILKRNFKAIDELFGTMKGAKAFERDRRIRI